MRFTGIVTGSGKLRDGPSPAAPSRALPEPVAETLGLPASSEHGRQVGTQKRRIALLDKAFSGWWKHKAAGDCG